MARLVREDKRLSRDDEVATTSLALQVSAVNLRKDAPQSSADKDTKKKKKKASKKYIEELKKRTKCAKCHTKGHWAKECPGNIATSEKVEKQDSAYMCEVSTPSARSDTDWFADSGASMHMTHRRDYFDTLQPVSNNRTVCIADDKVLAIAGIGTIKISETINGKVVVRDIKKVLFVPGLKRNLFSISAIAEKGFSFYVCGNRCEIRDKDNKVSSVGQKCNGLYKLFFKVIAKNDLALAAQTAAVNNNLRIWHERFGHIHFRAVVRTGTAFGLDLGDANYADKPFCEPCIVGKQDRKSHKSAVVRTNFAPGEWIHTDVCRPINIESPRGSRWFIVFKCKNTKFRHVEFMRSKSEAFEKFKLFESFAFTQTKNKIKAVRSDNGTEYVCKQFSSYLEEKGIIHELSSPYIHEQNGTVEREIRTLVNIARSMLLSKNVRCELWTEAVSTACYLLNRALLQDGESKTPFEKWFNRKPKIDHLRIFGTYAYLNVPKEKRDSKFGQKGMKLLFVGYDGHSTNYRLWDQSARRIRVSSDVDFDEGAQSTQVDQSEKCLLEIDFGIQDVPESQPQPILAEPEDVPAPADPEVGENVKKLRDRSKLAEIDRYGYPIAYLAEVMTISYTQALAGPEAEHWKSAVEEELQALQENNTWTVVYLPSGKKAIKCKWVFTKKLNPAGEVTRYRARLVAKGFSQREGIDYTETFAPVVRPESIRILLAIAAAKDLEIIKFDVKTAFLHGDLKEIIFMEQPPGLSAGENRVLQLQRSLYGLKQASHNWNEKFTKFLVNFNFLTSENDKCVFIGVIDNHTIYLSIYVDDGLLISKNKSAIFKVLDYLITHFQITSEIANDYVGFEIERNREKRVLKISQTGYINQILAKFGMNDAHKLSVPAAPGLKLQKTEESSSNLPYREAIGSLLFLARISRPDIEFSVNFASQFLECYNNEHWQAVKRIFRYLKGTSDFGIVFGNSGSSLKLVGFTDADYAGCIDTRKSRSGYVFLFNGSPVSWSSQRQNCVSLSTTESEYIALSHGVKEAVWVQRFLNKLLIQSQNVKIFVDNQSAIKLASNPEFHKRSKHIDVRYHYIRDVVSRKVVAIMYVSTKDQIADIMTKPLPKEAFCKLCDDMNVIVSIN